jgi:sulfite exporter TauE/SafE
MWIFWTVLTAFFVILLIAIGLLIRTVLLEWKLQEKNEKIDELEKKLSAVT